MLRKQAKLQWLEKPSEINGIHLNNVRCEASRHFRNKKREYLKDKVNELAVNSKDKNIIYQYRGVNEYKSGYQPRNNVVKDENNYLLADSHNLLNLNFCKIRFKIWSQNHMAREVCLVFRQCIKLAQHAYEKDHRVMWVEVRILEIEHNLGF
jgi:hypothetical protein